MAGNYPEASFADIEASCRQGLVGAYTYTREGKAATVTHASCVGTNT